MSVPVDDAERAAIQFFCDRTGDTKASFKRLTSIKRPETRTLQEIWTLMRAAGVLGHQDVMLNAAEDARKKIVTLRQQPEVFDANRRLIASVLMDLGRPGYGFDEIQRFLPADAPQPGMRQAAARMNRSRQLLGPLFGAVNRFLEGDGSLLPLENADLGLVVPLHLIAQAGDGETDLPATLVKVLHLTATLAQSAGLIVSLIPDYLFNLMENRPDHIFSFHTAGHFPGFLHFKKADLPDYLMIDPGGYSGWSTLSGRDLNSLDLPPLAEAKAVCERLYTKVVVANVSKYPQPIAGSSQEEPLPKRYVFVALQGPLLDAPHMVRFGTKEMLQLVVDRFEGTDVAVVVKLHPKVKRHDIIGWLIAEAETGTIILRDDSIHALVAGSEAVMTINSGVGSEAMIHRKPIYCFGASDYDSVVHRITSAEQFADLTTPIRPAVSDDDLMRFIAYYRTTYLIDRSEAGGLETALQTRVIDPILQARKR